jgi:hypothetical protein
LHFVTAGLTSNYRWWSNLQNWDGKNPHYPAQVKFHKAAVGLLKRNNLLEFVQANDAKNDESTQNQTCDALRYRDDGTIDGVEVWGKQSRLLYVMANAKGDEVEVLLGGGLSDKERARSILTITSALEQSKESDVQDFVANFPSSLSESSIAEFVYAKPSEEWPFPSCFHDPITVTVAIHAHEESKVFTKNHFQEEVNVRFEAPSAALTSLGSDVAFASFTQKPKRLPDDDRFSSIVRNSEDLQRIVLSDGGDRVVLEPSGVNSKEPDEVLWARRLNPPVPSTTIMAFTHSDTKPRWITGKQSLTEEQVNAIVEKC